MTKTGIQLGKTWSNVRLEKIGNEYLQIAKTINNKNMSWRPKQSNLFLFYAVSSRFIVYFKLLSNNGALTTI